MAELDSFFVEQAEYLDESSLDSWLVTHPNATEILRKLKANGAKLVIGPRGAGKTTLMLRAKHEMLSNANDPLPAYVNFKTSLRLEPLYRSSGNASFWFSQWLFLRTFLGVVDSLKSLGHGAISIGDLSESSAQSISDSLQVGNTEVASSLLKNPLSQTTFFEFLREAINISGRSRVVLLFDDAAHAFSPEQQRDFFDFFRVVKAAYVSPKAAVYPGVTDFSPSFHVGHDAEEVNVWLDPTSSEYVSFMRRLLDLRLPADVAGSLSADEATFQLLALAAFGIPRNLLNMVRQLVIGDDGEQGQSRRKTISRTAVIRAIENCSRTSKQVFTSLKNKLPTYASFVDQGVIFLRNGSGAIKDFNSKTTRSKSVTIALSEPLPVEMKTLFAFLEYSALLRPRGSVSRGVKGTFALFDIHYAVLIEGNALLAQKSSSVADLSDTLSKRDAHAFVRTSPEKLLGQTNLAAAFPLMLPPCEVCNTPRATADARFCLNCGSQLSLKSTFETAVQQSIDVLPLTAKRVLSISTQSTIRRVKDILIDKEHKELLKVKMIGPVWATRISRYAEEFIE